MTCRRIQMISARLGIDGKQLIDPRHDMCRDPVVWVKFQRLKKLSSRMGPTRGMHHFRPAYIVVSRIAVALQDAFELTQKPLAPFAPAPQPEVEHHTASRSAVLPQPGLLVLPPPI